MLIRKLHKTVSFIFSECILNLFQLGMPSSTKSITNAWIESWANETKPKH